MRGFSQLRRGQSVSTVLIVLAGCAIDVMLFQAAAAGRQKTAMVLLMLVVALYVPFFAAHTNRLWLAGVPLLEK